MKTTLKYLNHFGLIFLFIVLLSSTLQAQDQGWLTNIELAKNAAYNTNKLILMDFWATWCGPCKKMDKEVWSTEEAQVIKKNFIPLKIDIDNDRNLAIKYGARSIPLIVITDYKGEIFYSSVGYSDKSSLMKMINSIPANVKELYKNLEELENKQSVTSQKLTAIELQAIGKEISYIPLKNSFLDKSNSLFKKVSKSSSLSTNEQLQIELLISLNKVYRGGAKKMITTLEAEESKFSNEPLLYNFVLMESYLTINNQEQAEVYKNKLLASEKGISLLEEGLSGI